MNTAHSTLPQQPQVAIIDSNTFAAIGLRSLLKDIMPEITVDCFRSFSELETNDMQLYYHFFVTEHILFTNLQFFRDNKKKTIVLTSTNEPSLVVEKFHSVNVNVSESELVKSLLHLEQSAHAHGNKFPEHTAKEMSKGLSPREIEVLTHIVRWYINKEIADKLCISLSTVITHRKNITEKLKRKSVGALTVYAVMQGYIDIEEIDKLSD
mgnify:FL=1